MKELDLIKMGEAAIANRGNCNRLKQVMKRAEKGEHLVLGFLGGSITQGSLATKPELCYASLVYQWWVNQFPKASFTYVNAGVGGTTSHYATARVKEDLLSHNPDFAIIEFSVNDDANEHFKETYESVVRKVYGAECKPATLLVNNVYYEDGHNAQKEHVEVGTYYQLPCVSIKDSVYPQIINGTIERSEITPDGLHPNDAGHELVATMILHFLKKVYAELEVEEPALELKEQPLTRNHYAVTYRYQNHNCQPENKGFQVDALPQEAVYDNFKKGWYTKQLGASLVFHVTGTELAVQYRKTIHKPAPVAVAIVDGNEATAITLDGNFEETWGDCLYLQVLAQDLKEREHTIEVRIIETYQEEVSDFYLVSVITGEKNQ